MIIVVKLALIVWGVRDIRIVRIVNGEENTAVTVI